MTKYKQAIKNEIEMPEIGGLVPDLYVTIEKRFETLELLKKQANNGAPLREVRTLLVEILEEGTYNHDGEGKRLERKESEKDVTRNDLDAYIVANMVELWSTLLQKLNIISKEKAETLSQQGEELKN